MRGLRTRTQALLLLTATPMQVHPVEIWDLLDLLGLPPAWTSDAFTRFFEDAALENPSSEAMERMAGLFRAAESAFGAITPDNILRFAPDLPRLRIRRILEALRDSATIPRRQLSAEDRAIACRIMRTSTPVARLVSRNTRALLRAYYKSGQISTRIADRQVDDRFVPLTPAERALYDAMEDYISKTYQRAEEKKKTAVGFLLTIYRRRLASSFYALRCTLEDRLEFLRNPGRAPLVKEEDLPDDDTAAEPPDAAELAHLTAETSFTDEPAAIRSLLDRIRRLPPDSKLGTLRETLAALRARNFPQAMVFTQFTDTMDFLREHLSRAEPTLGIMCFSGRGGEVRETDGAWRRIGRDEVKRRFREGLADLLLCTDAAAEGLNFQFCGALVNYDMPWNPMRVEQRIGRIDRLGQQFETVEIANLHYAETVETDVYVALRKRIGLFEGVVGRLQPILARLPRLITESVLLGQTGEAARLRTADQLAEDAGELKQSGFDLDAITPQDLEQPPRSPSPLDMLDLDRVLHHPEILPPGLAVRPLGTREYALRLPGMLEELRISTDPRYVEEHPDNVELWSPGNPLFRPPDTPPAPSDDASSAGNPIRTLLSP
ncbi:MAG: helicase-related protein [Rhodospirillales bacterium]|nr:helicase-related protein [Rhodospirillales bacterium]